MRASIHLVRLSFVRSPFHVSCRFDGQLMLTLMWLLRLHVGGTSVLLDLVGYVDDVGLLVSGNVDVGMEWHCGIHVV